MERAYWMWIVLVGSVETRGHVETREDTGGDAYVSPLTVNAGQGYWLLVDNYAVSNEGFTLNWGGSGAPFLDCTALPDCTVSPSMTWD